MEEGDSTHTHTTGERRKEEDEDGGQHTHRTDITHQRGGEPNTHRPMWGEGDLHAPGMLQCA